MLRIDQDLRGRRVRAHDGDIGAVSDCYFDELSWVVRYLSVETDVSLPDGHALVSPQAVELRPGNVPLLLAGVTMHQSGRSLPIDSARPISGDREDRSDTPFGWPGNHDPMVGSGLLGPPPWEAEYTASPLHSVRALLGCTVRGLDGDIGHVADVLVDEHFWSIRYVLIDARSWLPGRHIVFAPDWFSRINWITGEMKVDLGRDTVRTSPRFERTEMVTDEYAAQLRDHYRSSLRTVRNRVEVSSNRTEAASVLESRGSARS
jgi:hypothetical protein